MAKKVTKVNTTVISAPEASEAVSKKKGSNLSALFLDIDGKYSKTMPAHPVGLRVQVGKNEDGTYGTYGEREILLERLPAESRLRLEAIGLKTISQNAVNTADTTAEGWEAFERRINNLEAKIWSETGGGGGSLPLYLQAFERVVRRLGRDEEAIAKKMAELTATYNDESGDEAAIKARRKALRDELLSKDIVEKEFNAMQQELLAKRAEALAKRQSEKKQTASAEDQLAALGI